MSKFKMSNGSEGMLRGQAPDAFQQVDPSMPKRSSYDTDFERMPVKPQKTHADSTGFTSQVADIATSGIMEQAITDRLNQTMAQGIEDGYNARMEEDAMRPKEVTDAEIDAKEDSGKCDDDDLEALRARRRQQMKDAHEKRLKYQGLGHGSYDEIAEEEFLKTVTASERCVVHFYHKMFEKCKVMDMHLGKCARKFFGTRFVKLDAEKAPFFVEKLKIKTLPCAVVFNDGVAVGRQVGFDGLGGEEFETVQLAWRIKEWKGIEEDFGPEDDIAWN
mmetsp:Transcript_145617/g.363220  ORF Transcript_145617/g.363220 Transcript_145617/m.363220 type:complete len:275 (+) Transcript_145617:96-920(+)